MSGTRDGRLRSPRRQEQGKRHLCDTLPSSPRAPVSPQRPCESSHNDLGSCTPCQDPAEVRVDGDGGSVLRGGAHPCFVPFGGLPVPGSQSLASCPGNGASQEVTSRPVPSSLLTAAFSQPEPQRRPHPHCSLEQA